MSDIYSKFLTFKTFLLILTNLFIVQICLWTGIDTFLDWWKSQIKASYGKKKKTFWKLIALNHVLILNFGLIFSLYPWKLILKKFLKAVCILFLQLHKSILTILKILYFVSKPKYTLHYILKWLIDTVSTKRKSLFKWKNINQKFFCLDNFYLTMKIYPKWLFFI